jgi:3-methyladenine DNA glycosylase/8-oxoguanine DNA glycosylase
MKTKFQSIKHTLEERTPTPFDFKTTATEHGWVQLRPFEWQATAAELSRTHRLANGRVVRLRLQGDDSVVRAEVEAAAALTPAEETEIRQAVRRMLRLDEDLNDFYHLAKRMNGWQLRLRPGGGRLLRCPTLFEDIVYTLCTTNIAWSGTIRMVDRLTAHLGEPFPKMPEWRAFPTPAAIAAAGAEFLRQETGLGYRSSYVWELAAAVVESRLDLARFEDPTLPTDTLQHELRQLKGIGPYAAATLLMILGRYDTLAIDTELRAHVSQKYLDGQSASEAQIRSIYTPWGSWQYLAYWFDSPA